jgi:asparagine synthase (glutamine-hydrolysing)
LPKVLVARKRQALSPEEVAVLIEITRTEPRRADIDGPDRSTLYAVATGTGFRLGELESLTPESFDLDADPFLDHVLFRFEAAVPTEMKIRGGIEKWLLRESLKDILPPAVQARRKHPFTAPPPARFAREFFRDRLSRASLADSPFFDPAAVCHYLDRLDAVTESARIAADPALMLVLTSVLLQQRLGLSSTE